jgi:hypothetical protein
MKMKANLERKRTDVSARARSGFCDFEIGKTEFRLRHLNNRTQVHFGLTRT